MLVPVVSERLYSPVYWILEDEFPDVWDDVALLGSYVQLLKIADTAWNGERCLARYPADVDWSLVARLKEAGLIIGDDRRYTIRGLDKRRQDASSRARKAGLASGAARRSTSSSTSSSTGVPQKSNLAIQEEHNNSRARAREDAPRESDARSMSDIGKVLKEKWGVV